MSQPIKGQGGQLGFLIGPKYTNLVKDIEVLVPFMFRCISFSDCRDKKRKISQPIRGQGGYLGFRIRPKNANWIENVEISLPVKIRLYSVQRFQRLRRSRKCLSQSETRTAIFDFQSAWKHKLGRRRWYIPSCPVSLYSVKRFQKKIENVSANQMPGRRYWISDRPEKKTNLVEDVEILLHIKFRWITFKEEVENVKS